MKKLFLLVILCVCFLLFCFSSFASPKIVEVANLKLEKHVEKVASNFKRYHLQNTDDFMLVKENEKKEITSIDYNMEEFYYLAGEFVTLLEEEMKDDFLEVSMPIGVVSNSPFFANLGPKIPVGIHFINSVFSQIQTKVNSYGINNALLEVYLYVKLSYEIISPVTKDQKALEYYLLLDSKVVNGVVPNWYSGNGINSAFFEVSFP